MFKQIIQIILDIITKILGNNEVIKEKEKSVEESYAEQEKARIEAETAKTEVINQGTSDDLFGSDKWNK